MKIIRVFGVVVGIHVFAFLVIFANPGCSSTGKPPSASDTVAKSESPVTAADPAPGPNGPSSSPLTAAPLNNDPVPAISFTPPSASGRYSPTRPGTTAATALESNPVADVTPASTYTVVGGDSLSLIAKRHKILAAELAAANNLKLTSTLRLGQKLIIPAKAAPAPVAASPAPAASPAASTAPAPDRASGDIVKHTVKAGDTLGSIAQQYGVRARDIGVDNKITDPAKIRPGQELSINLGKRAAAKPAGNGVGSTAARATTPAAAPSTARPAQPTPPSFSPASAGQDVDAGQRPASASDVPVIKVEEAPVTK